MVQVIEVECDGEAEVIRGGEAEVVVDREVDIEVRASPNNTNSRNKPNDRINPHLE